MCCPDWESLLERYHDGELKRARRERVEGHLKGCAACRAHMEQLESLREMIALPVEEALDRVDLDSLWPEISIRARSSERVPWLERMQVWLGEFWGVQRPLVLAGAAAACMTLLIAVPLLKGPIGARDGPRTGPGSSAIAINEVIVDSLQSGEHDMVLVNVHPEDMTTVIWLLGDSEDIEPREWDVEVDGASPRGGMDGAEIRQEPEVEGVASGSASQVIGRTSLGPDAGRGREPDGGARP